jgi:hypothetical protein
MTDRADPLARFVASIASVGGDEARKAKLLYVRNALVSYSVYLEDARTFGFLQLAFAIIPVFWPIPRAQRYSMIAGAHKQRQQLENALDVWVGCLAPSNGTCLTIPHGAQTIARRMCVRAP